MITFYGIFLVTLVPVGAALAVLLVSLIGSGGRRRGDRPWAAALAVAAGYGAGHIARNGWPGGNWQAIQAWEWLLPAVAVAAALAVFGVIARWPTWATWGLRVLLVAATLLLSLHPFLRHTWGLAAGIVWVGGLTAAFVGFWLSCDGLARRASGRTLPLHLAFVAGGTGVVLILTGSQRLAELGVVLAAALAAIVVVAARRSGRTVALGVAAVAPVALAGLWLNGHFYAESGATALALLALAPSAAWIGLLPPVRRIKPWKQTLVCTLAVAALVSAAVILAAAAFEPDPYAYQ